MDMEKVIKGLECHAKGAKGCLFDCPYGNENGCQLLLCSDVLVLLKEQEAKPLRCKTCTMRDKTGFCHRWNREVKDDDYCSFGAWKGC